MVQMELRLSLWFYLVVKPIFPTEVGSSPSLKELWLSRQSQARTIEVHIVYVIGFVSGTVSCQSEDYLLLINFSKCSQEAGHIR